MNASSAVRRSFLTSQNECFDAYVYFLFDLDQMLMYACHAILLFDLDVQQDGFVASWFENLCIRIGSP